jgi:hypothetical protein
MWSLVFLLDHEQGRRKRRVFVGLVVAALAVASHFWMSGHWMEQVGLGLGLAQRPPASAPAPERGPFDVTGSARDAIRDLSDRAISVGAR